MSLAFYASPIDFKNNDLDAKLTSEKNKLNKNMLSEVKPITKTDESKISISDIHKNLKTIKSFIYFYISYKSNNSTKEQREKHQYVKVGFYVGHQK